MKRLFLPFLIVAAVACGSNHEYVAAEAVADQVVYKEDMASGAVDAPADRQGVAPVVERKIIKEGDIGFETSDPAKTRQMITDAVAAAGGYIALDNVNDYGDGMRHHMSVRVPAAAFDSMLATITASAGRLESKNIRSKDVTEEFIDVQARVKTKKEMEERYKELLKRASSVEDMLAVERELGTLRSEIESVEGRLNYLTDRVAMSSLEINFYERGESNFGFGSKFGGAIKAGWDNLLGLIIGLIHIWPFLLVIAGSVWFFCRCRRKRKACKQNV